MKYIAIAILALATSAVWALDFETPHVGADIILEYLHFSGDSVYNSQGIFSEEINRYRIRKVAFLLDGRVGENISYFCETAVASCGGGSNLGIMEAGIFIDPVNVPFKVGIGQLHAMRGYSLGEECGYSVLLEKPVWRKTVSPGCHSLGSVSEFEVNLGTPGALSAQIGYFNGTTGTSEKDWDMVGWLQYHMPLEGLSVGGFYEKMHLEMNPELEGIEEADRFGAGIDMDNGSVAARVEFVSISGIPMATRPMGCEDNCEDIENSGLLVQAGYTFPLDVSWATGVRPYAGYQAWDRWSNADSGDWLYSWMEAGVQVNIEPESWITVGWRGPAETPEGQAEDSSVMAVRLGIEI